MSSSRKWEKETSPREEKAQIWRKLQSIQNSKRGLNHDLAKSEFYQTVFNNFSDLILSEESWRIDKTKNNEKKFLFFVKELNRFFSASATPDVSMSLVNAMYCEEDLKLYWKYVLSQDIINIQSKNRFTVIDGLPLIVKILPCILSILMSSSILVLPMVFFRKIGNRHLFALCQKLNVFLSLIIDLSLYYLEDLRAAE